MAKKFYTADFHLGMEQIIKYENRPFESIEDMNKFLIQMCKVKTVKDDIIIHVGDLATFKADRGNSGLKIKPSELIQEIPGTFINLKGNHDPNNKVFSIGRSLRTSLGKNYINVSVSHYPSYDSRAIGTFLKNDIHLCGHIHGKWKHCLDTTNHVLNINVGVDVWNYQIVSEEEIINYINNIITLPKEKIYRIKIDDDGKIYTV